MIISDEEIIIEEDDYAIPSFELDILKSQVDELVTCDSFNLISYLERDMFDKLISIGRKLLNIITYDDIYAANIWCYLNLKESYENYHDLYDRIYSLLTQAKESNEKTEYNQVSEDNAKFIADRMIGDYNYPDSIIERHHNVSQILINYFNELLDENLSLLLDAWQKMNLQITFRKNVEMKEFVVSEFRRFVKMDKYHIPQKIKFSAQHFKSSKLEMLSKPHWAKLAEADDEIIRKIINDETVDENSCKDLYDSSDLNELKKNKKLLIILRETSDEENLFDWDILFKHDELFDINVDANNVMFFFGRIHRENLIKCELYDGLKEKYNHFIDGIDECKKPTIDLTQTFTDQKSEESSEAISENSYINEQIDEQKLIAFIRSYTDGPNKSAYFFNKSHWISIYTVLRQNLKALGGESVFILKSRPKFVDWVCRNIQPQIVPCDKGAMDNAPKYFLNEKNYPWNIKAFFKAKGAQETTYNSYSMVADYFQKNLIERIEDFLKRNSTENNDLPF